MLEAAACACPCNGGRGRGGEALGTRSRRGLPGPSSAVSTEVFLPQWSHFLFVCFDVLVLFLLVFMIQGFIFPHDIAGLLLSSLSLFLSPNHREAG